MSMLVVFCVIECLCKTTDVYVF